MSKSILITGVTGQTGSFLANHMLELGYTVHGTTRTHAETPWRLKYFDIVDQVKLHNHPDGNLDTIRTLVDGHYDQIFHMAAVSSVAYSLQNPTETVSANIMQTTQWLESIRDQSPNTRFFNASSSEIFQAGPALLTETSPFNPTNPYAVTKLAASQMCSVFRESFGLFVVNGYLFNHESELRDDRFVTAKIVQALKTIASDEQAPAVELGNVKAERDFSYAGDFAKGMAKSLSHDKPSDYVFASGQLASVEDFFNQVARYVGLDPHWSGSGEDMVCHDKNTDRRIAQINPKFFRPIDEQGKAGDASHARNILGWAPEFTLETIVAKMVDNNLKD